MGVQGQDNSNTTHILSAIPDFDDDTSSAILAKPCVEATIGAKTLSGVAEIRLDLLPRPNIYIYCKFDATADPTLGLRIQSNPELI